MPYKSKSTPDDYWEQNEKIKPWEYWRRKQKTHLSVQLGKQLYDYICKLENGKISDHKS